jgi:hypothetical protein
LNQQIVSLQKFTKGLIHFLFGKDGHKFLFRKLLFELLIAFVTFFDNVSFSRRVERNYVKNNAQENNHCQ